MMTETGRVVALEPGAVWVETRRSSTCGSCEVRSGCGHGLLASMGRSPSLVRALLGQASPDGVDVHDEVRISIPERGFLRAVVLLYLLPLLTTLAAAILAARLLVSETMPAGQADLVVSVSALLGLGAGLCLVRWRARRTSRDATLSPVVTERL